MRVASAKSRGYCVSPINISSASELSHAVYPNPVLLSFLFINFHNCLMLNAKRHLHPGASTASWFKSRARHRHASSYIIIIINFNNIKTRRTTRTTRHAFLDVRVLSEGRSMGSMCLNIHNCWRFPLPGLTGVYGNS